MITIEVADIGKDEARQARRPLADAKPHGHTYAIDAVLAVIARQRKGPVTSAPRTWAPGRSWSRTSSVEKV
ncbi:hypothetical protein [Streptomyces chumphonensis]|uniref:hypothetical protein n=1 Tax=Streptomyces chumphonensis TaxID=1214925 RepID=UPI003D74910D